MKADESEATIRTLLDNLGMTFNLDRSFGDRSLGDHLDDDLSFVAMRPRD